MEVDYSDLEFDEEKYYLGTLCKRDHDWKGSGCSLRRVQNRKYWKGGCLACKKLDDLSRKEKTKKYMAKYYKENKEALKFRAANHYYDNIEDCKGRVKIYRSKNKEKVKLAISNWNKKNKTHRKIYARRWREENKIQEAVRLFIYSFENRESAKERSREWLNNNRKINLINCHRRYHWKGVMELLGREEASDVFVVGAMEKMNELIELTLELRKLYKEGKWEEYIMRVNQLIEEHGTHLSGLLRGEVRNPAWFLQKINQATNTHVGVLREKRKEVVTNAFNHPDQIPALIEL